MAPERGGPDPIDGRSDLYSLGCTLYHLLTGRPPFAGGDASAKVLRHRIDGTARRCANSGRTCRMRSRRWWDG